MPLVLSGPGLPRLVLPLLRGRNERDDKAKGGDWQTREPPGFLLVTVVLGQDRGESHEGEQQRERELAAAKPQDQQLRVKAFRVAPLLRAGLAFLDFAEGRPR